MTDLPHSKPSSVAPGEKEDESAGGFTRRRVLAGAAAATAAISVGAVDSPASAQTRRQDMVAFVLLSAALTGIAEGKLAPNFHPLPSPTNIDLEQSDPGSDPVGVKQEYFDWVNKRHQATFRRLLQFAKDSRNAADRAQAIIDKVQATPDTKYLARSIVLMWYLGALRPGSFARTRGTPESAAGQVRRHFTKSLHPGMGFTGGPGSPHGIQRNA